MGLKKCFSNCCCYPFNCLPKSSNSNAFMILTSSKLKNSCKNYSTLVWLEQLVQSNCSLTLAGALLPPCTQRKAFSLDPLPLLCIRTMWMTPKPTMVSIEGAMFVNKQMGQELVYSFCSGKL